MAKFIYSMQNVLNIKERMETQAKTEYAQMLGALHDEEVKMHNIMSTLNSYKVQASQLSIGKLDIAKIRRCNEAIKITEDMAKRKENDEVMFYETKAFGERCFGDLEELLNSDMDPKYLVRKLKEENIDFPKFYMACGLQDGLLPKSDEFAAFLKENGIDVTYETGPGAHEWDFWDRYIEKAIEWLPTDDTVEGLGSGNIGDR